MFILDKFDNKYKKIGRYLKLDKPLVIFDLETTGLSISTDKIVELAYSRMENNGTVKQEDLFINPEMKISLEASAVHGITDEMVADKPPFREVAQMLWEVFNGCYLAGFNIKNFDLPVLRREFVRVGMDFDYKSDMVIDLREIFRYMAPRTLSSAYEYYCGKELEVGHTAPLNAEVASEIFLSQLQKYKEVRDIEFLKGISRREEEEYLDKARKFYWKRGQAYFGFSKYKDQALSQVAKLDPKFLEWIMAADFSDETKKIVSAALEAKK